MRDGVPKTFGEEIKDKRGRGRKGEEEEMCKRKEEKKIWGKIKGLCSNVVWEMQEALYIVFLK